MKIRKQKGYFSISAVAKMFSVHQQTIRMYEKQGLLAPKRSTGNTRLFSEEDTDRLEEVIYLTHELGINLAGVEMIFKLKKQINKMQRDMNKLFEATQKELDKEVIIPKNAVKKSAKRLLEIKKQSGGSVQNELKGIEATFAKENNSNKDAIDEWKVEYED